MHLAGLDFSRNFTLVLMKSL